MVELVIGFVACADDTDGGVGACDGKQGVAWDAMLSVEAVAAHPFDLILP